MNSYILTNARIVTPHENFIGSVEIQDGLIADITKKTFSEGIDLHGQWLIPGCIDIHTDYLEKELHPRPEANFDLPFALHFLDARAASCGITTVFSAVSFSDYQIKQRGFEESIELARGIDKIRNSLLVRHFIHARIDPNTNAILEHLPALQKLESLYMVVYNENIPGERQYRLDDLIEKRAKSLGISIAESRNKIHSRIEETKKINNRHQIQKAFAQQCILGSHDDTKTDHVLEAMTYGATLSEMPTTLDAAKKAKELNMWVCMGAPNYYRGGSHCGNLSCHEAIKHGLVDILCSDYHFPTMLGSAVRMIQEGYNPSYAINLISLNPAKLLKFDKEIGSIELGKRADLVSFDVKGAFASVSHVFVDGISKNYSSYSSGVSQLNARKSEDKNEQVMYA